MLTLEGFLSMKLYDRPGATQEANAEASRQVSDGVEVRLSIDGGDGEGLKGQTWEVLGRHGPQGGMEDGEGRTWAPWLSGPD